MYQDRLFPDFIFESSWEVCNKVGGIYTVLSTRAKTLQERLHDNLVFIGPDCWADGKSPYFIEDSSLFSEWVESLDDTVLKVKVGRWDVPGCPVAILVDFNPFFVRRDEIFTHLWEDYSVDSLHAYGDYDEASMFSYAAARVVESFYGFYLSPAQKVVYHANEWMTGLGALYINKVLPEVATVFTTHATSIGRSICGNNKPLYDYLETYDGDQMACELNMQSKHSIEKRTAENVDCFTTVSDITAAECKALLGKECDVVLPNGFEDDFVPSGSTFTSKRKKARKALFRLANCLTGCSFDDDTLIVSTSGRYEFRNKGIDVFLESMNRLRYDGGLTRQVLALVEVPGWVAGPREDLRERMLSGKTFDTPLDRPRLTHWLHNFNDDRVISMCSRLGMWNRPEDKVKVIFIPCYLTGNDGILDISYYDLILANDLCVYPSYYEPWGYTPLEAVAFKVPCITTDLAGFGLWANTVFGRYGEIRDGVKVVGRTDYNYNEVVEQIMHTITEFSQLPEAEVRKARNNAGKLSKKALWNHFIAFYDKAYDIALRKAEDRKGVLTSK